jgi:hypothetical protein
MTNSYYPMKIETPPISLNITRRCLFLVLISALMLIFSSPGILAEKTPVTLTIKSVPDAPELNHGFHVTGTLSTVSGEPLGNKRITLESSRVHPDGPDSFALIAIDVTDRFGVCDFFRPKYSPPEFLRLMYAGNEIYEPAESPVLPVRGAGTGSPQYQKGTGSLTVHTNPGGADIYIDSEYKGTTPAILQGLDEGAHQVEVGLSGYQNETMEVYISPTRGATFSITLIPEGIIRSGSGLFSSLSYAENESVPQGEPVFSLDNSGLSMSLHTNATGDANSTSRDLQVTTVVTKDVVADGYDVMVIMTDH